MYNGTIFAGITNWTPDRRNTIVVGTKIVSFFKLAQNLIDRGIKNSFGQNLCGMNNWGQIFVVCQRFASNQNANKEARDFIKDVYQFIDQCGGVSDEQRKVFTSTVALGENMK